MEEAPTYVLFGKEAIQIYNMSINHLIRSNSLNYDIGIFYTVKEFVNESKNWTDFIEIEREDYLKIKDYLEKDISFYDKMRNKLSFRSFFESSKN